MGMAGADASVAAARVRQRAQGRLGAADGAVPGAARLARQVVCSLLLTVVCPLPLQVQLVTQDNRASHDYALEVSLQVWSCPCLPPSLHSHPFWGARAGSAPLTVVWPLLHPLLLSPLSLQTPLNINLTAALAETLLKSFAIAQQRQEKEDREDKERPPSGHQAARRIRAGQGAAAASLDDDQSRFCLVNRTGEELCFGPANAAGWAAAAAAAASTTAATTAAAAAAAAASTAPSASDAAAAPAATTTTTAAVAEEEAEPPPSSRDDTVLSVAHGASCRFDFWHIRSEEQTLRAILAPSAVCRSHHGAPTWACAGVA